MMSWFNRVNGVDTSEKDRRIKELEADLSQRDSHIEHLKAKIKDIENACRSASFEFDFSAVKVFSVERNIKDNLPCTIIGYLLPEPVTITEGEYTTKDVVREWYLYCDDKQHESIVKAFRESQK